jgi:hypothetical protein
MEDEPATPALGDTEPATEYINGSVPETSDVATAQGESILDGELSQEAFENNVEPSQHQQDEAVASNPPSQEGQVPEAEMVSLDPVSSTNSPIDSTTQTNSIEANVPTTSEAAMTATEVAASPPSQISSDSNSSSNNVPTTNTNVDPSDVQAAAVIQNAWRSFSTKRRASQQPAQIRLKATEGYEELKDEQGEGEVMVEEEGVPLMLSGPRNEEGRGE